MTYLYTGRPSVLLGRLVRREQGWPMGASGPAPVLTRPQPKGQRRRGPRNALLDCNGVLYAAPFFRCVRRVGP